MLLRIRNVSIPFRFAVAFAFAFAFALNIYAALHPNGPTKPESHAPATGGSCVERVRSALLDHFSSQQPFLANCFCKAGGMKSFVFVLE